QDYFVGSALSIADIALYAYTHVAHEGGFDLKNYGKIREWFKRLESTPKYIAIHE
ncbi:MAG: glutathione binding-like protein, partial [Pseudomonadota bacterium]